MNDGNHIHTYEKKSGYNRSVPKLTVGTARQKPIIQPPPKHQTETQQKQHPKEFTINKADRNAFKEYRPSNPNTEKQTPKLEITKKAPQRPTIEISKAKPEKSTIQIQKPKSSQEQPPISKPVSILEAPPRTNTAPVHSQIKVERPTVQRTHTPNQFNTKPATQAAVSVSIDNARMSTIKIETKPLDPNVIQCPTCRYRTTNLEEFETHVVDSHLKAPFNTKFMRSHSKKAQITICNTCGAELNDIDFKNHVLKEHFREYEDFLNQSLYGIIINQHKPKVIVVQEEEILSDSESDSEERSDSDYLSSSDEEPVSDEDSDSEYMAFITSTIDVSGLAAPSKTGDKTAKKTAVKTIENKFAPYQPIPSAPKIEAMTEDVLEIFNKMHDYEIFMCDINAVQYSPEPVCLICKRSFPTRIELIRHCYESHMVNFTPALLADLDFMEPGTSRKDEIDILMNPELRVEQTLFQTLKAPESPLIVERARLPLLPIVIILEALGVDIHQSLKHMWPRSFTSEVTMVRLPVPLPIVLSSIDELTVEVGFTDTARVMAVDIQKTIERLVDEISETDILTISINKAKTEVFTQEKMAKICSKHPVQILFQKDEENATIRVFAREITSQVEIEVKSALHELYNESELAECPKCHSIFSAKDKCSCGCGDEPNIVSNVELYMVRVSDVTEPWI